MTVSAVKPIETQHLPSQLKILPAAARTADPVIQYFKHADNSRGAGWRGIDLIIDTTLVPGSAPSTVFTIEGYDPVSAKAYTVLASAAVTAVGTVRLRVYPGATAAANTVVSDVLPAHWRLKAVHGNANSVTYTVAASLLP